MEPPELSARLRYLNNSAHLLATTAPATSRYLVTRHNSILFSSNIELSESQKRKACGACGTIMILGWEATLEDDVQQGKKRKGKPHFEGTKQPKTMVFRCGTCSKKTRISTGISKPAAWAKSTSSKPAYIPTTPGPMAQTSNTNIQSRNSKKKARAKGKLGALLAKTQASQAASSVVGLDLMDFMRKS